MKKSSLGLALLLSLALGAPASYATNNVVVPSAPWVDQHGDRIQAHGGGITLWKGKDYWFGEDRAQGNDPAKRYVGCYVSSDLTHWKSCGPVLALADPEHLGPGWVLERPKVYVNTRTHKFVLYAHLDNAHYKAARVMIAVSDHINGPYSYVKSFRPLDKESRDIGQFVDDDGSAYLIFESRPTGGFYIAKLTDDFMNVQYTAFVHAPLEGGALVHYKDLYYVVGSHMTGWAPNSNVYATAKSICGPWTEFQDIAPPALNTYGAQSTYLLKVHGKKKTSVIFLGDLWNKNALWDSRYLWMPLEIGDGKMLLPAPKPWKIDVSSGEASLLP